MSVHGEMAAGKFRETPTLSRDLSDSSAYDIESGGHASEKHRTS